MSKFVVLFALGFLSTEFAEAGCLERYRAAAQAEHEYEEGFSFAIQKIRSAAAGISGRVKIIKVSKLFEPSQGIDKFAAEVTAFAEINRWGKIPTDTLAEFTHRNDSIREILKDADSKNLFCDPAIPTIRDSYFQVADYWTIKTYVAASLLFSPELVETAFRNTTSYGFNSNFLHYQPLADQMYDVVSGRKAARLEQQESQRAAQKAQEDLRIYRTCVLEYRNTAFNTDYKLICDEKPIEEEELDSGAKLLARIATITDKLGMNGLRENSSHLRRESYGSYWSVVTFLRY